MKSFDIPAFYRSPVISQVKNLRKEQDPRKKDFSPTILDFGPVQFFIARHFGFCYGVENAIEIAYRTLRENPGRRIFLLSEMIHNPHVNEDLKKNGIQFLMNTEGSPLHPLFDLGPEDIVLIPAFGTTVEIREKLERQGLEIAQYDTTCPFVTKVWKRADALGKQDHTIVVHGKHRHEETRATFSHSQQNAPTVVVRDMEDSQKLAQIIKGELPPEAFYEIFAGKHSADFEVERDLQRLAVVNQTTMLATETQAIADFLKQTMIEKYGEDAWQDHFADTRDTLCYATNDNQRATYGLLEQDADLAIVVGGYNSSNTSHLVELCEEKFPTFFISAADKILSRERISHFNFHTKEELETEGWLPERDPVKVILTSGASCPDSMVDEVLQKVLGYFESPRSIDAVLQDLNSQA